MDLVVDSHLYFGIRGPAGFESPREDECKCDITGMFELNCDFILVMDLSLGFPKCNA